MQAAQEISTSEWRTPGDPSSNYFRGQPHIYQLTSVNSSLYHGNYCHLGVILPSAQALCILERVSAQLSATKLSDREQRSHRFNRCSQCGARSHTHLWLISVCGTSTRLRCSNAHWPRVALRKDKPLPESEETSRVPFSTQSTQE